MEKIMFEGSFKTVKVDKAKYELYYISVKGKIQKIGENQKLIGAKDDAKVYVLSKNPKATHFQITHTKPGREKDAKEVLTAQAL